MTKIKEISFSFQETVAMFESKPHFFFNANATENCMLFRIKDGKIEFKCLLNGKM